MLWSSFSFLAGRAQVGVTMGCFSCKGRSFPWPGGGFQSHSCTVCWNKKQIPLEEQLEVQLGVLHTLA